MPNARTERTLISALKMMFFKGIGAFLGLAAALGIAFLFGTSAVADAYFFARRFVSNLASLAERIFETIFVPGLVREARRQGLAAVLDRTRRIELVCFGLGLAAALLAAIFAPAIVSAVAPGMEGEGRETAIFFLRVLLIVLPISIGTSMTGATLTSLRVFTLPVIARLAQRVFVVLALLLVPLGFGLDLAVYGVVAGGFVTLFVMLNATRLLRLRADRTPVEISDKLDAQVTASLAGGWGRNGAILVLSGYFVIVGLIDTAFASIAGVGGIAILALSQRVSTSGAGQVSNGLMPVYYTNFSETSLDSDGARFQRELSNAIRAALFFIAPIGFLLIGLSTAIADLVLANGAFEESAAAAAATIIALFAVVTLINTPVTCMQTAMLAHPMFPHFRIALTAVGAALVARVVATWFLIDEMGVAAVAIGALAGSIVYFAAMTLWATRLAGAFVEGSDWRAIATILLTGVAVAGLAWVGADAILAAQLPWVLAMLGVGVLAATLGIAYGLILAATGLSEAREVLGVPLKMLRKLTGRAA